MSVALTGKAPYKKIVCTAMLLAQDGKKLSKSSPNNIPVDEAFEKIGADVIRYLFASNNMMSDVRFGFESTDEIKRKLLAFWNAYVFFNTYAVIDNPNINNFDLNSANLTITDKWLFELTNQFISNSKKNYENQKFYLIVKDFENYVDDLTNWYIRINRRRFWKSENKEDQLTAYFTLYSALKSCIQVMSPIIPFLSEYIYQNLVVELDQNAKESIFLEKYPQEIKIDCEDLIWQTAEAREIITLAQRLRNEHQIKIKQPLRKMFLNIPEDIKHAIYNFEDIIKDEINVKEIIFEKDNSRFNDEFLTLNFGVAGRILKSNVQKAKEYLSNLSKAEMLQLVSQFKNGTVVLGEFGEFDASLFNLVLKPKEEFIVSYDNNKTIVLDTTLDRDLIKEGNLRELIRQIQVLRKDADFKVEQRIKLALSSNGELLKEVISESEDKIKCETLAINVCENLEDSDISNEVEIGEEKVKISLKGV